MFCRISMKQDAFFQVSTLDSKGIFGDLFQIEGRRGYCWGKRCGRREGRELSKNRYRDTSRSQCSRIGRDWRCAQGFKGSMRSRKGIRRKIKAMWRLRVSGWSQEEDARQVEGVTVERRCELGPDKDHEVRARSRVGSKV